MEQGDVVGRYELTRRLGGGAFGEVWLARHLDLGAERAVKVPTDRDHIAQLRKEGRIQLGLQHPNVVATIDLNLASNPPYFVMEYVEGEDLRKHLKARSRLPADEALAVLGQVLEALDAAHAQGILHRDLKPENILITPDGTVKVTDFGLGKVQAETAQSIFLSGSMMTMDGKSVSGTFEYMSPEQRVGRPADVRDDIYSVGIIACELLTGSRPPASGVVKAMRRADVAEPIAEVVDKACDELEYRFASAAEMLAEVRALHSGPAQETAQGIKVPEPPKPLAFEPAKASASAPPAPAPVTDQAEEPLLRVETEAPAVNDVDTGSGIVVLPDPDDLLAPDEDFPLRVETEAPEKDDDTGTKVISLEIDEPQAADDDTSVGLDDLMLGDEAPITNDGQIDPRDAIPFISGPPRDPIDLLTEAAPADFGLESSIVNKLDMQFRLIRPGTFKMGMRSTTRPCKVTLTRPFYLSIAPVTQSEFKKVMGVNRSEFKGLLHGNHPVEQVGWQEARDFCKRLSRMDGGTYRLPTEAEWEYACQCGRSKPAMVTGPTGWFKDNSRSTTHPVLRKKPNGWNLYDMLGNVWEWCQDWHGARSHEAQRDPSGPSRGRRRVARGGAWDCPHERCTSTFRGAFSPMTRLGTIGFRVVREAE